MLVNVSSSVGDEINVRTGQRERHDYYMNEAAGQEDKQELGCVNIASDIEESEGEWKTEENADIKAKAGVDCCAHPQAENRSENDIGEESVREQSKGDINKGSCNIVSTAFTVPPQTSNPTDTGNSATTNQPRSRTCKNT